MAWLRRLVRRAKGTASPHLSRELRAELESHLQLLEEEYRAQGLPPREARRLAHLDFGNVARIQETSHELLSFQAVTNLVDDARYALRQINRSLAFTCAAVFSLAIGIVAATTAFTITDSFLIRALPVRDAAQLYALSSSADAGWTLWPYASFVAWRDSQGHSFELAASAGPLSVPMPALDGALARVSLVSGSYFRVLGVDMSRGRVFADAEGRVPLADPVAVVSDAFRRRWFGGEADIAGKTINLNGTTYEIVGITRPRFTGDKCGVPLGVLAMRPLYADLYGVEPFDPLTLLAAIVLLGSVALLACWKPAHNASRLDPASLLRSE